MKDKLRLSSRLPANPFAKTIWKEEKITLSAEIKYTCEWKPAFVNKPTWRDNSTVG